MNLSSFLLRSVATAKPLSVKTRAWCPRGRSSQWTVRASSASGSVGREFVGPLNRVKSVCWISFWAQLALSLSSTGLFFFTIYSTKTRPISYLLLLIGVASSLISAGMVRKILSDAQRVTQSVDVRTEYKKWKAIGWLLRNTDVNLIGMASTIIALQGECGTLVAKLLRTTTTVTPYSPVSSGSAPASIDVFAVQGCANILLSHFVSLFFVTFALRILQRLSD